MAQTIVAKRYAKALFEAAKEQNLVVQVEDELKLIVGLIDSDQDFGKFLHHPNISAADKIAVISKAFDGKASNITISTLQLLITRGRGRLIASLYAYYLGIANEAIGQANAIVTTPASLTAEKSERIAEQFGKMIGKRVLVENVVDPDMLGGLTVRIGDRLYDGSLSGKIARLKKSLNAAQA